MSTTVEWNTGSSLPERVPRYVTFLSTAFRNPKQTRAGRLTKRN
jgi:hypothetical protein